MGRILVIDDEPHIAELYSEFLSGKGYEVYTANHGSDAAAYLENNNVSLVVSDFSYHGREEVEGYLKLHPNLPVIVVTSRYDDEEVRKMAREDLHAREILPKPMPLSELSAAVKRHYQMD